MRPLSGANVEFPVEGLSLLKGVRIRERPGIVVMLLFVSNEKYICYMNTCRVVFFFFKKKKYLLTSVMMAIQPI